MVCRECGAYNPEHLSHCRICAARLRDADPADVATRQETVQEAPVQEPVQEDGHPSREFVRAPSWPTRPYTGAPEKKTYAPPRQETPIMDDPQDEEDIFEDEAEIPSAPVRTPVRAAAPAGASVARPAPVRAAASAPAKTPAPQRVCSVCGKPMLPDAPFCAYCGAHEGLPGAEPTAMRRTEKARPAPAAEEPVSRVPARSAAVRKPAQEFMDFDDEDDEEMERIPPKKAGKSKKIEDDFDDEDLDDYDDEEYDDDYDEDEEDDAPRKKSKGTTILFWVLIVLLLALIAVFAMYMLRNNGSGGTGLLSGLLGGASTEAPVGGSEPADSTGSSIVSAENSSRMYTCTVTPGVNDAGVDVFNFLVYAPTNSTVTLSTSTSLEQNGQTTVPNNDQVILEVPQSAFLPGTPCDAASYSVKPAITVTSPDGQVNQLDVPEVTLEIPQLVLNISEPSTDTVTASYNNAPITITGQVEDRGVEVYVNGQKCTVYDAGIFEYEYQPAGGDVAETVYVEAKKNNYVTAVYSFTVEPYVVQNMTLLPTNDASIETRGLLATKENSYTVVIEGTVTPGATLVPTCADANVVCGTATVSEAGSFQCPVTVNAMGAFEVTLTGTMEGYNESVASVFVERTPTESSSTFKKGCTTLKSEGHAQIVSGATTTGNFTFTGTITEVISSTPYEVVRMTLSSGEEVIVTNRGKSRFGTDDVKKKKTVAGVLVGLYPETTTPHLWGWFAWNAS